MRLLSWLLCAAAAVVPVLTSQEKSISRPKRDSSEKRIVCYYTNWSVYRPGSAKYTPQNINPYLCTHLIYAFGGLSKDNALKPFDKYQDIEQGGYAKFNGLKTYNKKLKTMLAIGGWNEGSVRFSPLVADAERRKELVKNTVKFLRQNHFDGLDLDWEYPSFRDGGKPRDRDNYATLVQEFREEFERESEKTGRPRLLLTMAVPAGIEYIDKGYDIPKLNKYLDWMNILSYDYHSAFEPAINHHSPLFSLEEDDEYNFDAQLNIDHTVKHYLKLGADRNKLVLGIPTYGRSYTLFNPDATDIGSPADGPGEQGEATREKGYLAYYEICDRVKSGGWNLENPNPEAMGPYAYKDNQWVGFDDEDIVKAKAKYVNDNDLGGIMFWSIDNDDFRGKCHGKPYPLIEAAKESLLANANDLTSNTRKGTGRSEAKQEQESLTKTKARKSRLRQKTSTTTESSKANARTTTTPQPPTTPDPGSDFVCKDEGFFPHPRDCKKYFWCLDSGPSSLGIVAHQFTCPSGLVFNKISDSCDYARNVICKTKSEPSTTTSTTTTTTTTTSRPTTARSRLVITASPPRSTTPTTTTTTTEAPDEEEEEEDEEDPGTIKELIQLIKKLGGVEQLEKQLNLQNADGKEKIKPSLYSRVLQGRVQNRYRGVSDETTTQKYVSVFRNRPVRPQSPNVEENTTPSRSSDKPRYVTIQRNRPTKKPQIEEESEEEEEEQEEEVKPKVETPRSFRRRPNIEATSEREYVVLRRTQAQKEEVTTQKYKNIVRVRSTTKAPVKEEEEEEEEDEEEDKKEEKALEEDEEIIEEDGEEEEEQEEIEPGQKQKKYSSIVRDNKKQIPEEKEPKVSGPQGPRNENEESNTTRDSILTGKDYVNTVNIKSSPIYTEIRRKQSTASPLDVNVNSVNILHDDQKNKEETNEVTENETENKDKTFQRRITTEIVSKPTKPTFITPTLGRVIATTEENKYKDARASTFTERFTNSLTDSTLTTKPFNRYKTINRNNPEKPAREDEINQPARSERKFQSTSTTVADNKIATDAPRKFQFAPRKKPDILAPKPLESTTEILLITVPEFISNTLSDNTLGSSLSPASTKSIIVTEAIPEDVTNFNRPHNNDFLTTFKEKQLSTSTRRSIPSTSTQTTVVTSITESSVTERRRILVSKKALFKSALESKFAILKSTSENPVESTTPLPRFSGYRTILRSTTPEEELTEPKIRRFNKFKSTTTENSVPERKFVPKKGFKRTTTEEPEIISSTTERFRFRGRNKPRQTDTPVERNNLLQARFSTARRKKILSKKEDDLEVQQTATFFDDFDGNDRVILGGGVKQTSEKDYLNADVYFRGLPVKEKNSGVEAEEDVNPQDLNKIAVTPVYSNNQPSTSGSTESIGNRFGTLNPAFRNLRSRTRKTEERVSTEAIRNEEKPATVRNFTRKNFQNFRSRGLNKDVREKTDAIIQEDGKEVSDSEDVKKITPITRNFRSKNRTPLSENVTNNETEKAANERVDSKPLSRNIYTPRQSNFVRRRTRVQQINENAKISDNTPNETNLERPENEQFNDTEENPTLNTFSLRNLVADRSREKTTEIPLTKISVVPTQNTNLPTTNASQRFRVVKPKTEKTPKSSEPTTAITKALSFESKKYEQVTEEVGTTIIDATNPTVGSTFGSKTIPTISSTTNPPSTFGTKIGSTLGSTFGLTTSSRRNSIPTESTIKGTFITYAPEEVSSKSGNIKENETDVKNSVDSNFQKLRGRSRGNSGTNQGKEEGSENKTLRGRGKVKAIDSIFQATEGNAVTQTQNGTGRQFYPKERRKVLVRTRPVKPSSEPDVEENELEPPEEIASKSISGKRVNQENVSSFRTRNRSTQSPPTTEQTNKRRTQLDRRRFRGESRTSTVKPDVPTETSVTVSKSSILLRRRLRPTTSTTTTTQKSYIEQQEDSSLEESKSIDETPDIQDLADPAVVAIHYLATVSPGPGASGATSSLNTNSYPQTSDTYTVHVTPSDIASFSTPKIPAVTPGSPVSLRPTSILTLKPYTTPLITKQYAPKQSPSPFRTPSPFRGAGIPIATEDPYSSQGEILIQSRKQDTTQRTKPTSSILSTIPQKAAEPKSRRLKPFSKVPKQEVGQAVSSAEPPVDYEYYDDDSDPLANIPASALKVKVHSDGYIECLDRGNFPHPFSCKKFISCAKMENNELLGWEYTCPKHLSFDPVGGICNWSAGLGCQH